MIEALLSPSAMEKQIYRLKEEAASEQRLLEDGNKDARARADQASGSKGDLEALGHELDEYRKREVQDLSGSSDPVWIPRDPIASLVLSAYHEFFEATGWAREVPAQLGLAGASIAVSRLKLDPEALDFLEGQKKLGGRWLTKYGERDVRFLTWGAAAMIATRLRGKHAFRSNPASFPIGDRDRVLLVGDWGSGIPRALQVSTAMRASLEQALREERCCHVIHLGDVYYTGQPDEYRKRFLNSWPVKEHDIAEKVSSWCLNGNHDMYSGGYGYFGTVLTDARFAAQTGTSYFSLENNHWQILGLDSSYDDGDLHGPQPAWVQQMRSAQPNKAGILLSHHQPFSSFEGSNDKLLDRVRPTLDAGLVRAWFWGHEHRCAAYEPRENIQYPRLVGHGGVPVWAPQSVAPTGVSYQYGTADSDYFYSFGSERFLRLGFAELTFDQKLITVRYVNELGMESKNEVLQAGI